MNEDLYQLLGLRRDASEEEIKRAYRQLAMRHHPDRTQNNPRDTEIFKAVAVAFATLSHPEKRAEYDRRLAASERRTAVPRARTARAGTSDVRRQENPFGEIIEEFFLGRGARPLERNERVLEVTLTRHEAWTGVSVPVDVPWKDRCPLCQGSGLAPFSICTRCRGSGSILGSRRLTLTIPPGVVSGATQRLCLPHNHLTVVVRINVR
jgi:molecular chaperone DnaJ